MSRRILSSFFPSPSLWVFLSDLSAAKTWRFASPGWCVRTGTTRHTTGQPPLPLSFSPLLFFPPFTFKEVAGTEFIDGAFSSLAFFSPFFPPVEGGEGKRSGPSFLSPLGFEGKRGKETGSTTGPYPGEFKANISFFFSPQGSPSACR